MTDTIRIYEDNAGAVYLERDGEAWALGPVTPDMYGHAEQDAARWHAGEWAPNENDGQTPADVTDLDEIAKWVPGYGLSITTYDDRPGIAAGMGGAAYLGIDSDADEPRCRPVWAPRLPGRISGGPGPQHSD